MKALVKKTERRGLPLTPKQRRKASIDLTQTFFLSYFSNWRLTKILTVQKLLKNRHVFYKDIMPQVQEWESNQAEAAIAQEVHNGLYHDAISQCIQYIEDLFALIKATKQPDFFVRNIITYEAGAVIKPIEIYKSTSGQVIKDFFLPTEILTMGKDQPEVISAVNNLVSLLADQVRFYKDYKFFYNQYKHGLSIPLRAYGNTFNDEQIEKDKKGEMEPFIAAYDNLNLAVATTKGTTKAGIVLPGITDNVAPYIHLLEKENNFLRFVFPPDVPNFDFKILVEQAYKTRACINTLIANYQHHINVQGTSRTFQLPTDYKLNHCISCSCDTNEKL